MPKLTYGFYEPTEDIARIKGKLENIMPVVKATLQAFALEAKGHISKPPKKQKHRRMKYKSARQRAYVAIAIREGLIDYPYRRAMSPGSEALSKSWTIGEENDGLRAVIGNDTSYGPFVQDRDRQSLFHDEGNWLTVQFVQEMMQPKITSRFQAAVRRALAEKAKWAAYAAKGGVTFGTY